MAAQIEPGALPVSVAEVRDWLRLGRASDDAPVAAAIRAAASLCEAMIGQLLLVRTVSQPIAAPQQWTALTHRPVVEVAGLYQGAAQLPPDAWTSRILPSGDGAVRLLPAGAAAPSGPWRAAYRAGMADDPAGLPEALRQGLVRMAAHLLGARDGGDGPPPAIVAALWAPWRRLDIGAPPRVAARDGWGAEWGA